MKKLISLILSIIMSIALLPHGLATTFAAEAYDMNFIPNHIRIKVNVKDWDTGELVPGVTVGITRRSESRRYATAENIITCTSDENGVAYVDVPYITDTINGITKVYLNGIKDDAHVVFDSSFSAATDIRFDMEPLSSGYSLEVSTSKRIRNLIFGANGGAISLTRGTAVYDDFYFHDGITKDFTWNFSSDSGKPNKDNTFGGGAAIEFELYVKSQKFTLTYDTTTVSNATDFASQTVMAGETFTENTTTPVNKTESAIEFKGWVDKDTGMAFDFSKPVVKNTTLVPKWGSNPYAKGYIHLNSYLWDHDAYNGTYGTGQTTTPVTGLKYKIEYYDLAVAATSEWKTLTTVEVDSNGQADFELTPEMLSEISDFRDEINKIKDGARHVVCIDIGPVETDKGWNVLSDQQENYAWDWIQYNDSTGHGEGVTGVRTMLVNTNGIYNLDRDGTWVMGKNGDTTTPTIGNVQYSSNTNHTPCVTEAMLEEGFEITWNCYVSSSMIVQFDLNGGEGTKPSDQKFKPINSIPSDKSNFLVNKPTTDPTMIGKIFLGWYKVNSDGTMETMPWDFASRVVTESMVLKAVYVDKVYNVQFVTPENGTQTAQYKIGGTPAWTGANPTKTKDAQYTYEFDYWEETTGISTGEHYTLNGTYDFEHQSRTLLDSSSNTVAVTGAFADTTVYKAHFKAVREYKITYNANGGTLSGSESQTYKTTNAVTLQSAPTRDKWVFKGWRVETAAGNWMAGTYTAGQSIASGKYGDVIMVAQWEQQYQYQLTFHENTSDTVSNMPTDMAKTAWITNATYNYEWTNEPTRTGYTFLGWSNTENGEVNIGAGTKACALTGKPSELVVKDLYAVWKIDSYKATASGDTGIQATSGTNTYEYKANVKFGATLKKGYDFVGWYNGNTTEAAKLSDAIEYSFTMPTNDVTYYAKTKEQTATYKYEAVCKNDVPAGTSFGSVSVKTETVGKVTGKPESKATAQAPTFRFVGWYDNADGTGDALSTNVTYNPANKDGDGLLEGGTFYAVFEYNVAELTIEKAGAEAIDENQSFIFTIKGTDSNNAAVSMTVTVQGNSCVTIKNLSVGNYTVTEVTNWSWRYTPAEAAKTVTVNGGQTNVVTFNNTRSKIKWLSGDSWAINTAAGKKIR